MPVYQQLLAKIGGKSVPEHLFHYLFRCETACEHPWRTKTSFDAGKEKMADHRRVSVVCSMMAKAASKGGGAVK
jgi:hypothetical protein